MIIIRSTTEYANIENNFEDDKADEAFDYQIMLEQEDWPDVKWIYLPGLTFEQYIKNFMKSMGRE